MNPHDLKNGDVVSGRVLVGGVPLCRDCRWYDDDGLPSICTILKNAQFSTGWMRTEYGYCGPEGKLWEPRLSLWRRLFRKGA